jgi:hypothetical protein
MKLPLPTLDLATRLVEFDVWITPSLGEVRDTERFRDELRVVVQTFESLGTASGQFKDVKDCQPSVIAEVFVGLTKGIPTERALEVLQSLASVLFLVTGKSDNNAKCQLPLFSRDKARWGAIPIVRRVKGRPKLENVPIPRELKAKKNLGIVAGLADFPDHQKRLLEQFVSFLLSDDACISQLWSIGYSYFMLKPFNKEKDLLSPLVIFQVRGSVASSGGHDPEDMLRQRMLEWGLEEGTDFNSTDVVLTEVMRLLAGSAVVESVAVEAEAPKNDADTAWESAGTEELAAVEISEEADGTRVRVKTRAYDFILPYHVRGWQPKLFVQSQFYAGDSGSVSHKNVDQTSTSRAAVLRILESPRFVEYVDGAGYFSSLNGDLKNLLNMPTTASFFQVRSASVRLRRELQHVGFLLPVEVEQAVLRTDGKPKEVRRVLSEEGYAPVEIERCVKKCIDKGTLLNEGQRLSIGLGRRDTARRYFLMDVAVVYGSPPASPGDPLSGSLLVPGYGPFYGTKLDELAAHALRLAPGLKAAWSDPTVILGDIRWLCDQGMAMSK